MVRILGAILIAFCLINFGECYLAQLAARLPLPGTPSPPGSPWPKPETHELNLNIATIGSRDLQFLSDVTDCEILNKAFSRYNAEFLFRDMEVEPAINTPVLSQIQVIIPPSSDNLCQEFPKLYTEEDRNYERYEISITETSATEAQATITAQTVWGALYGIETFSQLIWMEQGSNTFYVNLTEITDAPRFSHRGFMIDTARHYVDLPVIRQVIDGLAMNKLNVLHWHIVDDQSFPFVSTTYPELSQKGAYLPELTYEPEEVQGIMSYARDRGIRVILEFDTPGHTQGFGKAFPEILTPCYGVIGEPGTPNYPSHAAYEILDPTNNRTYEVMREFFKEIKEVSKDEFVHLGMDEVYYACWQSSPEIRRFMDENGFTNYSQVQGYYTEKLLEIIKEIGLKPIIWHDPLEFGVDVPKDVQIQVWKGGKSNGEPSDDWIPFFKTALEKGYQSILSSCWYLNYISYGEAWRKYYECDPIVKLRPSINETQEKLVLGGEGAIWAEFADPTNLFPRLFPFISAMAERVWSPEFPVHSNYTDDAMWRLDEHRCRMLWRGYPAQPIFNGYCFAQEKTRIPSTMNNVEEGHGRSTTSAIQNAWLTVILAWVARCIFVN